MPDSKSLQNVASSGHAPPGGGLLLALGAALSAALGALVGTVTLLAVALVATLAEGEPLAVTEALGGGALAVGLLVITEPLAAAVRLGTELATGAELAIPSALALGAPEVADGDAEGRGDSDPGDVGLQEQSAQLKLTQAIRTEGVRRRGPHDGIIGNSLVPFVGRRLGGGTLGAQFFVGTEFVTTIPSAIAVTRAWRGMLTGRCFCARSGAEPDPGSGAHSRSAVCRANCGRRHASGYPLSGDGATFRFFAETRTLPSPI